MNVQLLGPVAIRDLNEIDQGVQISSEARRLIAGCTSVEQLLKTFVEKGLDVDAIQLFPYLVPVRKAIWWACICSWHGSAGRPQESEDAAFRAVVRWVQAPSERQMKQAQTAADGEKTDAAGGYCARAIVWAGFLASPEGPWKANDPRVAAKICAGCVLLALSNASDNGIPSNMRQMLKLAFAVSDDSLPWIKAGK